MPIRDLNPNLHSILDKWICNELQTMNDTKFRRRKEISCMIEEITIKHIDCFSKIEFSYEIIRVSLKVLDSYLKVSQEKQTKTCKKLEREAVWWQAKMVLCRSGLVWLIQLGTSFYYISSQALGVCFATWKLIRHSHLRSNDFSSRRYLKGQLWPVVSADFSESKSSKANSYCFFKEYFETSKEQPFIFLKK